LPRGRVAERDPNPALVNRNVRTIEGIRKGPTYWCIPHQSMGMTGTITVG